MNEMRKEANAILESDVFKERGYRPFLKAGLGRGMQTIHTPFDLCHEIISKLAESVDIKEQQIAVLFNLEFTVVLIEDFGVRPSRITFIADDAAEEAAARHWYNIKKVLRVSYDNTKKKGERIIIMPKPKKQFDVLIMNPPYQGTSGPNKKNGGKGSRNTIWDKFVEKAIEELVVEKGWLAAVHPPRWRKPGDSLYPLICGNNVVSLALHDREGGKSVFGAGTAYDWYVLQKSKPNGKCEIKDTKGNVSKAKLTDFPFLPNFDLEAVWKLLAKPGEETCDVLFSYAYYETRKKWMSDTKTRQCKHPCVHLAGKTGITYWYSSKKTEFFGVPKVIFGDAEAIYRAIVDMDGKYAMTQHAIGFAVKSKREAEGYKRALESPDFNEIVKACRWSQFQIDWRLFKYFRRDFWKDFV